VTTVLCDNSAVTLVFPVWHVHGFVMDAAVRLLVDATCLVMNSIPIVCV